MSEPTAAEALHASAKRRLRLVDAQTSGGLDPTESLERQVAGLMLEISSSKLDTDAAADLMTALCAMDFSTEQKRRLCEAIGTACNATEGIGGNAPTRKQQSMKFMENFLTKTITEAMADKMASMDSKASLLAAYLHRWGVSCPQEMLCTQAASLLYSFNEDEYGRASPTETQSAIDAPPF